MPAVRTSAVIDGMVLQKDAVIDGKTVLPAGTVLEKHTIRQLAAAGIHQVAVTDESYGLASMFAEPSPPKTSVIPKRRVTQQKPVSADSMAIQANLLRLAHMFEPYREDALMRELLRLAIRSAQERRISV